MTERVQNMHLFAVKGYWIKQAVYSKSFYLKAELIAGNSQNHKPFIREAFMELVHLGVIPGGRSSKRSDILDQDHLAL